jgi:hypothetical protein
MARTERRGFRYDPGTDVYHLQDSCRDNGCQHGSCTRWKRPARRAARFEAKAELRRDPESASVKAKAKLY